MLSGVFFVSGNAALFWVLIVIAYLQQLQQQQQSSSNGNCCCDVVEIDRIAVHSLHFVDATCVKQSNEHSSWIGFQGITCAAYSLHPLTAMGH